MQREITEKPGIGFRGTSVPPLSLNGGLSRPRAVHGTWNYLCTSRLSRTPRCCRTGFPLLENATTRRSGCRGPSPRPPN